MPFVLKRIHEAEVKRLEEQLFLLRSYFELQEKQYKAQIEDLRRLVFPAVSKAPDPIVLEADSVISGSEKPSDVSEEEQNKHFAQVREVDLLFSGNYSEDLLQ